MSTDTADAAPGIRETVETVEPGDRVELADEHYQWATPLDIVETRSTTEWDVPFGDDWWTRTIIVEGGNGGRYAVTYAQLGETEDVDAYRVTDDGMARRGTVEHLALADADPDAAATTDDDQDDDEVAVTLPDDLTPSEVERVVDEHRESNGKAKLGDVADTLGLSVGRARSVTHALDLYGDQIVEVYRPSTGGGA